MERLLSLCNFLALTCGEKLGQRNALKLKLSAAFQSGVVCREDQGKVEDRFPGAPDLKVTRQSLGILKLKGS